MLKTEKSSNKIVWEDNSRSWWHQYILVEICEALGIYGLEFVMSNLTCLQEKEMIDAINGVTKVLETLSDGIPFMKNFNEGTGIELLRKNNCSEAFSTSPPSYDNNPVKDNGIEATIGFYIFFIIIRTITKGSNFETPIFYFLFSATVELKRSTRACS